MSTQAVPVLVVLPPRCLLLDVAGPLEVLRRANMEQRAVRFDVRYVAATAAMTSSIGLRLAGIAPLPRRVPGEAIVLIAGSVDRVAFAAAGDRHAEDAGEQAIVDWLRERVGQRPTIVSICSGGLLAGRAGLLDGRACTTHFSCCAELAAVAPAARVVENRLYVEDGRCWTSAGVTAGIDLMLHLVARLAGVACAVAVARHLVVYLRRGGGDPQLSPWLEGRNHIHPAVHHAQDLVAADPAGTWSLAALAARVGASPRHLSRLFNQHAGMSLPEYVGRLRICLAQELLGQTRLDMERIAERCGFASARQLRRAWHRSHATPPRRAREAD
ncbi:GlxA family transcriptional regulator [Dokdonella koreensis]|uniref:Transcriptional regulator, AraC family n=1 Tax=Dokdonella koreensis DS-123 TaxID=1300342 RepID=A0A167G5U0_9GAMM|nr:helix-turn-helix domain-containing protein [Dokdonella koreensis]ANB16185.1 Transcriptional regulator, AraC family [Dokdonella koreensis DS-123]